MALQARFRFGYPAADLFSGIPAVDLALDEALGRLTGRRPPWPGADAHDVFVMGFPRSANTYLTYWLHTHARVEVTVHDGRLTHSALDVHRLARQGAVVVLAVREPVATVASFMVRGGTPDSLHGARVGLRAYGAWYRMATKALGVGAVSVMPFELSTSEPEALASYPRLDAVIDRRTLTSRENLVAALRSELQGEPGQGESQGGVPAEWMISLPDEHRAEPLAIATATIRSTPLRAELRSADRAFLGLMAEARRRDLLVTGASAVSDAGDSASVAGRPETAQAS